MHSRCKRKKLKGGAFDCELCGRLTSAEEARLDIRPSACPLNTGKAETFWWVRDLEDRSITVARVVGNMVADFWSANLVGVDAFAERFEFIRKVQGQPK